MNPLIQLKTTPPLLITLALLYFGLLPKAQAVSPPPPGGYPNFTTAAGDHTLQALTIGVGNTALGTFSMFSVTTGSFNTGVGAGTLVLNTGDSNTAIGAAALLLNTSGTENTAVGTDALVHNDSGTFNIAIGDDTPLSNNVSGSSNIVVGGFGAGFNIVAGSNNIYIGPGVSANGPFDESDTIRINDSAPAAGGATSQVFFAGIDGSTVGAVNAPVLINPNGQLGTGVSSARFKKDINPMGRSSEAIFSLKPVTFHYKGDTTNTPQCGLIAEEVAKVNPALILTDKEGKPYSVRYEHINAMLLNEFLKEHKKVEAQQATIAELRSTVTRQQTSFQSRLAEQQKQIEALASGLQKVSAQLEVSKPAPQLVLNNQ